MKIALIGYGKMGKAIEEVATNRGHDIVLRIDRSNRGLLSLLKEADLAIEMTGPESAAANILECIHTGIPVVSGSTGWMNQMQKVKDLCKEKSGSFLYASNFSIGVNLFFQLNELLAGWMHAYPEYTPRIEETHHTEKKDKPSGTAITIAESILRAYPELSEWTLAPASASADNNSLLMDCHRIDPAPGTHTIRYTSQIDTIEITHTAHNRKGFAQGAVFAAEFLFGKQGVYSMKDVLRLA
jgi:4-hydroxy-tetrahydrodipicolinate reductase